MDDLIAVEARHVVACALGDRLSLQRMGLINRRVADEERDRILTQYRGDDPGLIDYYRQTLVESLTPNPFHPTWALLTPRIFDQVSYLALGSDMEGVRASLTSSLQEARDRVRIMIEQIQFGPVGSCGHDLGVAFDDLPRRALEEGMFDMDGDEADCSICMNTVELGVEVLQLLCGHWFHPDCIIQWLRVSRSCPFCRQAVSLTSNVDASQTAS